MTSKRLKVLVIAEAANPEWISVPLVGWSMANALRDVADTHVVTQVRNWDALTRAGWVEGTDFTAIDTERFARPIDSFANLFGQNRAWTVRTALDKFSYAYFEKLVWDRFGPGIRSGAFDIVHRITPVSPAISSSLAQKCKTAGVDFVLGPINGGVPWPKGFEAERKREKEWLSNVRNLYKVMPGHRRMLKHASAILVGSKLAEAEIPPQYRDKTIYLPENAVDPAKFSDQSKQDGKVPIRACFIGRLVPLKGVDMLLQAAAPFVRDGSLLLDIIGDGPMRQALESIANDEGIAGKVTFHGMLPHDQVGTIAAKNQMMIFPSIREFGGGVVLEAMALGVVPAVIDYAGPAELVDENTGYKIPIGSREDIIGSIQELLSKVIADPAALGQKSVAARQRVHDAFTWSQKAKQMHTVYDWVLNEGIEKPSLF